MSFAGEAFVSQDDLPAADQVVVSFEEGLDDVTFTDLGVGQSPDDGIPSAVVIRYSS